MIYDDVQIRHAVKKHEHILNYFKTALSLIFALNK